MSADTFADAADRGLDGPCNERTDNAPMTSSASRVTPVELPAQSRIRTLYPEPNLADAFAMRLPDGASTDPETLARHLFGRPAPWVAALLGVRDAMVGWLGLKTAKELQRGSGLASDKAERIFIFRICERAADEIVLGEDDSHLDFRASLLLRRDAPELPGGASVTLSTVVRCHNRLGRFYIFVIAPFHRLVVKSALRRGARRGWPLREHPSFAMGKPLMDLDKATALAAELEDQVLVERLRDGR